MKLRYADFVTETRDATLKQATDHDLELLAPLRELLHRMATRRTLVRLLGVRLGGLSRGFWQGDLFDPDSARSRSLVTVLDQVREKYGVTSVRAGETVWLSKREGKRKAAPTPFQATQQAKQQASAGRAQRFGQ